MPDMQPNTTEAPKRGRKPARAEPASDRMHLRVPPHDKAAWQAKADAEGKTLSMWVVDTLNDSMLTECCEYPKPEREDERKPDISV